MAYIYKITNDINNKIYVGKTLDNINKRFKEHIMDSKRERCNKRPLYDAMNKYGIEHFYIQQLEECSCDLASEREIYWIDKLNSYHNGYNATYGGEGQRCADYDLIYEYWKQGFNIKEIHQKTNYDTSTIKKALLEHKVTSEAIIERGRDKCRKAVMMIDIKTGEILNNFSSPYEAGRFLGEKFKGNHIREACKGLRQSAYGYKWKFLEK